MMHLSLMATALVPTTPIAPGVDMPMLNFGFQKDHVAAIAAGVRGIDTANVYGDPQQREVGRAVRDSCSFSPPSRRFAAFR